jgi:hypothetical protein
VNEKLEIGSTCALFRPDAIWSVFCRAPARTQLSALAIGWMIAAQMQMKADANSINLNTVWNVNIRQAREIANQFVMNQTTKEITLENKLITPGLNWTEGHERQNHRETEPRM